MNENIQTNWQNRTYITQNNEVLPIGTMYCIGRNYSAHAKEMNAQVPVTPLVFLKPACAYTPDRSSVTLPTFSQDVHHEVELVVVIGKDIPPTTPISELHDYIYGYAVGIDFTLRDIQTQSKKNGEPWAVAKGFKQSAPISSVVPRNICGDGPFTLSLMVNNHIRQHDTTENMEHSIPKLMQYLMLVFELRAGDCIFTGTPQGVSPVSHGDHISAELVGVTSLSIDII